MFVPFLAQAIMANLLKHAMEEKTCQDMPVLKSSVFTAATNCQSPFFFWLLAWSDFICGDWVFHRQSWNLLELFLLGNMFVISNVNIDPISINKPNMMFFLNIISFVGDCRP